PTRYRSVFITCSVDKFFNSPNRQLFVVKRPIRSTRVTFRTDTTSSLSRRWVNGLRRRWSSPADHLMPFAEKLQKGVSPQGHPSFAGAVTLVLLSALFLPSQLPAQGGRPGAALLGLQGVAEASMGGALAPVRESS